MKTHVTVMLMTLLACGAAHGAVDAIYSVPTAKPELSAVASYPTRSDQNSYGSPEVMGLLRFALPQELTGLETDFQIVRLAHGKWSGQGSDGSKVTGECGSESKEWFTCRVAFENLKFDEIARAGVLEKAFGRGLEFTQRLEVARFFEGQPIGIIKVRTGRD